MPNRDITIAELPATTVADDNSYIPIDNGDVTCKIKVSDYNAGANATARAYAEAAGTSANSASANAGSAATYASNASQSAQDASDSANTALNHANNASLYANNAYEYAAAASTSASNATSQAQQVSDYAREAGEKSEDAEAFALGQRKGVDVDSEDATYQNNAKYFSGLASDSANDASAAANRAESAVVKAPYIGSNDHWYVYDFSLNEYVDTAINAAGNPGTPGTDGKSAYQIAVQNGYEGTESQWVQGFEKVRGLSLQNGDGVNSLSMNNPNTVSTGAYSIAEGNGTKATGTCSHAEGIATQATGVQAHSEGDRSQATRNAAHAEGYITKATGNYSHSQNEGTIAKGIGQTAIGAYNIEQGTPTSKTDTDYAFIIGNGTDENNRSNALAVKWDGTLVFSDGSELQSNYYVTPEMFGAVGDGVTNDLAAFQAALLQAHPIYLSDKHYLIDGDLYITQPNTVITGKVGAYSATSARLIFTNQHGIHIEQATYKMLFKGFAIFSDGTGLTMQGDGRIANLTFEDLYFKCRRDVFLDAETGYIYFRKCHFDFDPNTTFDGDLVKITYTGNSANRANYISFNQCEFEGQNIPNHLSDANCYLIHLDNCSNINITASDICNCYNAIKFGSTGPSQYITLTDNYFWNIKTIANIASCLYFNMTGNSQYTSSGCQPIIFPSNQRGHIITGNIFSIGSWAVVTVENLYTVFSNNYINGALSDEVASRLHIKEKELENKQNDIAAVAGEYLPVIKSSTNKKCPAAIGATTAIFSAGDFMAKYNLTSSDLHLDVSAETQSGNVIAYNSVTINSNGGITITFDALTEAATFVCKASKIN